MKDRNPLLEPSVWYSLTNLHTINGVVEVILRGERGVERMVRSTPKGANTLAFAIDQVLFRD